MNTEQKDQRLEQLKADLLDYGRDYIEEFIGYEYPNGEDCGVIEARIDAAFRDMDEDTRNEFFQKFCIDGP